MERKLLLRKLDKEMRNYRLAAREKNPTNGLLRAVREALRIPFKEMSERTGVGRKAVFELEEREETGAIMLRSLGRMAEAMGCKVVYGVVPLNGKTLEDLAEERLWRDVLGSGASGVSGVGKTAAVLAEIAERVGKKVA
jgi:transcriptional regulator with XRE-family HTH domain